MSTEETITNLIKGVPDWHDTINSNFQTAANAIDDNVNKIGVLNDSLSDIVSQQAIQNTNISLKANQSSLNSTNDNVATNTQEINSMKNDIATNYARKSDIGAPTDAQLNAWLSAHPEATTTVQDDSIVWSKFTNELKTNISKLVTSTVFNVDGSIKETFSDNQYKITIINNNIVTEQWYDSSSILLFTKTTTINPNGSISETLV